MNPRKRDALLKMALAEDAAHKDITSRSVIPQKSRLQAAISAKEPGILAGIEWAARVFRLQDNSLLVRTLKKDGSAIKSGQTVLTVEGKARSIFAAERVALNFLGHLSGIATLTNRFVHRVRGTRVKILDTRKTLPGLRVLEKYAVRVGGGYTHRGGLDEAVLIKTNHLKILTQDSRPKTQVIQEAIGKAKKRYPRQSIGVEVTTVQEFRAALPARPTLILLDNMPVKKIREVVHLGSGVLSLGSTLLEVSGGVTLANVRAIAKTGVDRISIGRLTHSAPTLNLSLQVVSMIGVPSRLTYGSNNVILK